MNNPMLQKNFQNYDKTASTENQRSRQYLISFFIWGILVLAFILGGYFCKDVLIVEDLTVGYAASKAVYIPLIFAVVDLGSALYHFVLFLKLKEENPGEEIRRLSIWADWETGERSPVKATLAIAGLMAVIIILFVATTIF